jgi:hypothetical protein
LNDDGGECAGAARRVRAPTRVDGTDDHRAKMGAVAPRDHCGSTRSDARGDDGVDVMGQRRAALSFSGDLQRRSAALM